jgi:hypothetical protein
VVVFLMNSRGRTVPIARALRARRDKTEVRKTVAMEVAELEQIKRDNFLGDDVEEGIRIRELPVGRELAMRRLIIKLAGGSPHTRKVA